MISKKIHYSTIAEYIGVFDSHIQLSLENMRKVIREEAPETEETINYQIPTFKMKGKNLVHFAAYKTHIGFYPTPSAISVFKDKLGEYKTSKGTIQFSLEKELPLELIREIVQYRVAEVLKSIK